MYFYKFLEEGKSGWQRSDGITEPFSDELKAKLLETVPFVFTHKEFNARVNDSPLEQPLDLPFKSCFFEVLDSPLSVIDIEENGKELKVLGLWVSELSPKQYELFILVSYPQNGHDHIRIFKADKYTDSGKMEMFYLNMIDALLDRIAKEEIGYSNPRKALKVKIGGIKVAHRIDKIVYICPKKNISSLQESTPKAIDWSHQWSVRGHWRSIPNKIGRDREGNPIKDNTWVKDHIKGPEDAPFVAKTRLIKE